MASVLVASNRGPVSYTLGDDGTLSSRRGGGGLVSGIAIAAKALKPDIAIIGVEAALYPAMSQVLRGEEPHAGGVTVAEGIAVKRPGEITRRIVKALVEDVLLVGEDALENAVLLMLEIEKSIAEGAGAAALAALMAHRPRFAGKRVETVSDLHRFLIGDVIGTKVELEVLRGGARRSLRVLPVELAA